MAKIEECALDFLCGLTAPLRASIKQAILGQVGVLEAELTALNAQLAALEAQLLPAEILLQSLTGVLEAARANAIVQLLEDAIQCADIGKLNESLGTSSQKALTEATDAIEDLRRKISVASYLQDRIDDLGEEIDRLGEYLDEIDFCENRNRGESE